MGYTKVALEGKIFEMYPDIGRHGISMSLDFNREKNAWIILFKKDGRELTTHLEKKDAEARAAKEALENLTGLPA